MTDPHPPRSAGRPPGFDREAVLDIAMEMLWNGGFEATPVGDVIDAMGLSRSSFYAAFGSKRGVMLDAIGLYSRRCVALLSDIAASGAGRQARLREMVHALAAAGDDRGCFMANCISELARRDAEVRRIAAHHNAEVERIVSEVLGGPSHESRAPARAIVAAAYGATLLKISGMDRASLRETLDALIDRC